jgi:alkanesulfonate monooxygenase SsuD/methylene tetrahydromethanopterin reductase-like flavin-dependent oxidoreductase (luciferase family)
VRYAVSIPPFTDAQVLVGLGIDAEARGWDGILLWDHLQWETARALDIHDPWAVLSAVAARTERIMLGTAVTPLARRRPWVLAKQVATLDHLSGGRAVIGVGLGEPGDADFGVFGDEADRAARGRMVDEGLVLFDRLLRGEAVVHHGVHYDVEAQLRPPPVQRPRPRIFVAGTHPYPRPLRRALSWDGFFPISYTGLMSPDQIATYLAGIDRPTQWDLDASLHARHSPGAFEAVGVTWLVEGIWPDGDWVGELRARIQAGPPR